MGIVVESIDFEDVTVAGGGFACRVHGTIRNESGAGQRVTLGFSAFNVKDAVIARATATVDFVDAGRRANYEARFRVGDRFVTRRPRASP